MGWRWLPLATPSSATDGHSIKFNIYQWLVLIHKNLCISCTNLCSVHSKCHPIKQLINLPILIKLNDSASQKNLSLIHGIEAKISLIDNMQNLYYCLFRLSLILFSQSFNPFKMFLLM